jgi:hypothetical protein
MDESYQGKEGIIFGGKKDIDRKYGGSPACLIGSQPMMY